MEADYQIATFRDQSGLEAVMTTNKLYIKSRNSSEVFALRAIVGSGVYDDISTYAAELKKWKNYRRRSLISGIIGLIIIIPLMSDLEGESVAQFGPLLILVAIIFLIFKLNEGSKPTLFSYFNLMTLGGTRKFKFDKSEETSASIADFNSKLEETFTSYRP